MFGAKAPPTRFVWLNIMRILALDYGDKRIGVAISDPLGITAQPVAVIQKNEADIDGLAELKKIMARYEGIEEILVGLPKKMSGEAGPQVEKVNKYVALLKENLDLEIRTLDERLSTVSAEKSLISAGLSRKKRRQVIDKTAATFILQGYLDSK